MVFSTLTDTGADRLRGLYPESTVFYWPLDLSPCAGAALRRVRPDAVALVELEIWPNFLSLCRERGVPVAVVNGRINPSSADFLRAADRLLGGRIWGAVDLCCTRSARDAARFDRAGLAESRIVNTGSLKYDALPLEVEGERVEGLRAMFGIVPDAPTLVAGSTHPGEDEVLTRIYLRLRGRHPGLRLVLVPRHIERAEALARSVEQEGAPVARKTALEQGAEAGAEDVIVVDTIGDLTACYALADCVYVGRSLFAPGGGQNMMEPAGLGRAVIVGPHTGNFGPEMELLREHDAVAVVGGEGELERRIDQLLGDPRAARELGERARRVVTESRGAAGRTLRELEGLLRGRGLL